MAATASLPLVGTIQNQAKSSFPFSKLLRCIIIVLVVYGAHAAIKHGIDAYKVRECIKEKGAIEMWQKPDGRIVSICSVDEGVFGLMITEGVNEITSFIKDKMTKLEQVQKYLENMDAVKFWDAKIGYIQ